MKLPSLFRLPEAKKFNYTPRFYNPKSLTQEQGKKISFSKTRLKNREVNKFSTIIRLILILFLGLLIWFFLNPKS